MEHSHHEVPTEPRAHSDSLSSAATEASDDLSVSRLGEKSFHRESQLDWLALALLALITYLAAVSRYHKISEPDHVCWDETHFGKHASWYIKHEFFFDVHPPLGKMLIAFVGELTGYNGTFAFAKPGDKYSDPSQFKGMRIFSATLGWLLVPLCFGIVWRLTTSLSASLLGASFVLADTGTVALTQYILLDPPLLFSIFAATFFYLQFRSHSEAPFTIKWWIHLSICGIFLACAISTKFVGLFVILLIGLCTVKELWDLLGDWDLSLVYIIKHFIARCICLILLPVAIYACFFHVHLELLHVTGTGDGFYSSAFQSQLEGNSLYKAEMPAEIAYGATVTLKNHRTGGAYLHSHYHIYPEEVGPKQQQVTTYSHKDENNVWLIKRFEDREKGLDSEEEAPIEVVKSGDWIRLEHVPTRRNLHSHKDPAPITKRHYQVTCYGEDGRGDVNDIWRVEILNGEPGDPIQAVKSKVRLIHVQKGCTLQSHNKKLPNWGFEQLEVTCNPKVGDLTYSLWNFEDNVFPRLPNVSFEFYRPSFQERFIESHLVMLQGNSGLKPKEGETTSRPWHWPLDLRGQIFSGRDYFVYLLGNPIVFWTVIAAIILFGFIALVINVSRQRHSSIEESFKGDMTLEAEGLDKSDNDVFLEAASFLLLGYALHYLPFFLMGRVLYFHHYFPALLFGCMLTGVVIDYLLRLCVRLLPSSIESVVFHMSLGCILAGLAYSFFLFSPLAYGMKDALVSDDPASAMHGLKWLDTWEF